MPAGCSIASCRARPNRARRALARPSPFSPMRVQTLAPDRTGQAGGREGGGRWGESRTQLHLSNSACERGRWAEAGVRGDLVVTTWPPLLRFRFARNSRAPRAGSRSNRIYTFRDALRPAVKTLRDIKRARDRFVGCPYTARGIRSALAIADAPESFEIPFRNREVCRVERRRTLMKRYLGSVR